ncbi:MAG: ATP-binding protein [Burkholderiales bacterium]|nr:ATP-binding protein [Phycisphaerae bacterium]
MSYTRIIGTSFGSLREIEESDAEILIQSVEAFIRSHGKTHLELAELAKVDPAAFTLFLQRKLPGDWRSIASKTDDLLARLYERIRRESMMPVRTPMVIETLGMVRVLMEDGGIALIQGDSGTGKTEAIRAVALKQDRAIIVQASTARARPKPMMEDIGHRMGISYHSRDTSDTYRTIRERLPIYELLIIDEVHKYIGSPDCLHVLADLLKETNVPQLWTATGDLRRYLDRRVGHWRDPFAQIRSRISHTMDLSDIKGGVIRPEDVRELARRKFALKLDAAAARELCDLACLDNEGSLRLVENTLKHAKRFATSGKIETIDLRIVRLSMDRSLTKRTRERARRSTTIDAPAAVYQFKRRFRRGYVPRHSWQSIRSAAARLGRSPGHLRRLCELSRIPAGMFRRCRLASGQTGWEIRTDFTPARHYRRVANVSGCTQIQITAHSPWRVVIDVFRSDTKGD